MPASAYDFEKVRRKSTLSCVASSDSALRGAKSTYASSITTTPEDAFTTASTRSVSNRTPVGELGLTTNFSGAASAARLGGSSSNVSHGWVEGTAPWRRQSGSRYGYVGGANATFSPGSTNARKHSS